jgi:hypothetical protein
MFREDTIMYFINELISQFKKNQEKIITPINLLIKDYLSILTAIRIKRKIEKDI